MELIKSTDVYSLIKINIPNAELINLYNNYKSQMTELDLSKKFKQYNYKHTQATNPQWLELKVKDKTLDYIQSSFGLENLNPVISLSELPIGYELSEHKDIGRRTVLLIPISGVDTPINIQDDVVYYNENCLLMDATIMHSVPKTKTNRITLQFAFRQNYKTILENVKEILCKNN